MTTTAATETTASCHANPLEATMIPCSSKGSCTRSIESATHTSTPKERCCSGTDARLPCTSKSTKTTTTTRNTTRFREVERFWKHAMTPDYYAAVLDTHASPSVRPAAVRNPLIRRRIADDVVDLVNNSKNDGDYEAECRAKPITIGRTLRDGTQPVLLAGRQCLLQSKISSLDIKDPMLIDLSTSQRAAAACEQGIVRRTECMLSLEGGTGVPVYELTSIPGLLIAPRALPSNAQRKLAISALQDFAARPNVSNLDTHWYIPRCGIIATIIDIYRAQHIIAAATNDIVAIRNVKVDRGFNNNQDKNLDCGVDDNILVNDNCDKNHDSNLCASSSRISTEINDKHENHDQDCGVDNERIDDRDQCTRLVHTIIETVPVLRDVDNELLHEATKVLLDTARMAQLSGSQLDGSVICRILVDDCPLLAPRADINIPIETKLKQSTVRSFDAGDGTIVDAATTPIGRRGGALTLRSAATRLRWCSLGMQYHWAELRYHHDRTVVVPHKICELTHTIAEQLSSITGYTANLWRAEAGIVNVYRQRDTLTAHQDRSEDCMTAPLISVSLGSPCVFVVGTSSRDDTPQSVLLSSGDIVALTGAARLAFHGVPRVFGAFHPKWADETHDSNEKYHDEGNSRANSDGIDTNDYAWDVVSEMLRDGMRININVRQVHNVMDLDNTNDKTT